MAEENGADKTLFAEERKRQIVDYINEKRRVTVPELCEYFSVSGATMRNDLRELGKSGQITRTHGGAVRRSQTGYEPVMDFRADKNIEAKRKIARLAINEIDDGDTIILDTGTTIKELAVLLKNRNNLSVVTNDIKVAAELENAPGCEVYLIGGLLRKGFHCTVANEVFTDLRKISVDKVFLGANSFSARKGASTPDVGQSDIKRQMIEISSKVILLCDSTKLETDSFINFASTEQIDLLITDTVSADLKELYESLEINVTSGPGTEV